MPFLLDTTVLIDYLRGDQATISRVSAEPIPPMISAVSIEELEYGVRARERGAVEDLIASLIVVRVGRTEARLSGRWRREHSARGITLEFPDTLIAACAVTRGAILATANVRDFPMPELQVERWPSEPPEPPGTE